MKKVGILTFWESNNNYGQILQLFAMQSALKNMGLDAFAIKYYRVKPLDDRSFYQKLLEGNILKSIKYRLTSGRRQRAMTNDLKRNFKEFKNNHINFGENEYRSLNELKSNPPVADVYVVGSDQVWNHTFKVSVDAFLLGFGAKDVKRIAYAASFGVLEQDADTAQLFKRHLKEFDAIAVREESGKQLVEDLGFKADWVLDPTLLFTKPEWVELLKLNKLGNTHKKKQVFLYMLGNSDIVDKQKYIAYAKGFKDHRIVHATANSDFSGNAYPTIQEWVYYITTSELVITTSFHGMIFCILNNTNFIVLPNTGKAKGMNERVESMLSALGLKDHLMKDFDKDKAEALKIKRIDWNAVNSKLSKWREKSKRILEHSINA